MQKLTAALRIALLCAPVALVACADQMPTGYTYHNEVYKSPPGPEASPPARVVNTTGMNESGSMSAGLSASEQQMASNGLGGGDPEAFRDVADQLIQMMLTRFGRPMERVFVNESSPMTASLKASMMRNEIPVAVNPGDGPFVLDHEINGATATITFFSNHDSVVSYDAATTGQ